MHKQFGGKQGFRHRAIAVMKDDVRILRFDLDPVDRMHAAIDPAHGQLVGEPSGAGAETRADFKDGARPQFSDQRRIHGEIEDVLHQRHAAPAHQRRRALTGQKHVGPEFGAEARMIMRAGTLPRCVFDEAALPVAVEELAQPLQVPEQAPKACGLAQCVFADTVLPGARRVETDKLGQHAGAPAVEDAGQAVLLALDLGTHFTGIFERGGFEVVARDQIRRLLCCLPGCLGHDLGS